MSSQRTGTKSFFFIIFSSLAAGTNRKIGRNCIQALRRGRDDAGGRGSRYETGCGNSIVHTRQSPSNQTQAKACLLRRRRGAHTKSQDNGIYCHKKVGRPICSLSINQSENWCSAHLRVAASALGQTLCNACKVQKVESVSVYMSDLG